MEEGVLKERYRGPLEVKVQPWVTWAKWACGANSLAAVFLTGHVGFPVYLQIMTFRYRRP